MASKLLTRAAIAAAVVVGSPPALDAIRVGEPFPDLVLPRVGDGAPQSPADFRGERVVLHVFASW